LPFLVRNFALLGVNVIYLESKTVKRRLFYITFAAVAFIALARPGHAAPKAGDVDGTFKAGTSVNGPVYSIAVQTGGQIVVGGGLAGGIARLNSDGGADTNFLAVVSGASGEVDSIVLQPDGKPVIGGFFTQVNGITRNGVARLNTNGSLDTGFLNGTEGSWLAYSIPPFSFYSYAGQVNSIALQSGTNVFVGGDFNRFNLVTHYGIVRLNSDGGVNTNFVDHWNGGYIPSIFSTVLQPDGKVFIGGDFGIVRLNPDGHRDTNFVTTVNQSVNSIVLQPDGKVLIGGNFTSVNGANQSNIARVNTNCTLDTTFLNGLSGADDRVFTVVLQPDGKILMGGLFLSVNGTPCAHIARLNPNGIVDASFLNGLSGADGPVISLALQPDGRILVGGEFSTINDSPAPYVARLYGAAPLILSDFGIVAKQFGFTLSGESNQVVIVEASTNLSNWSPLRTNTLGTLSIPFSDSASSNFPDRFYRVRLQ